MVWLAADGASPAASWSCNRPQARAQADGSQGAGRCLPAAEDHGAFGALLESFVFSEVLKLMTASDLRLTPHHFRDRDMREVDIVLERDDGMIAAIEVKASATVKASDFSGLRALAEACGDRFAFGAVLYDSTDVVPFGDRLAAAPLSCLWA